MNELRKWSPGARRVLIHKSGEGDGYQRSISPGLLRNMDKWLRRKRNGLTPTGAGDVESAVPSAHTNVTGVGYVVVTSYEHFRLNAPVFTRHNWGYAVLDEGQKIRNPDADVTLRIKSLRTVHRVLLSGTPIQNNLRELWSLFDFVFPGRLGTLPAFEIEFEQNIRVGGYRNATPMQVQLAYRCALALKDLIDPYLLRRRKKDIPEVSLMPGKTEQILFCRLSGRQRSMYEAYLRSDDVCRMIRTRDKTNSTKCFSAITALRKMCNHPDLICRPQAKEYGKFLLHGSTDGGRDDHAESSHGAEEEEEEQGTIVTRSGKMAVLAKVLPLWQRQGHRVLIFTQTRKMLNLIQRFTIFSGMKFGRIDGNTGIKDRQKVVDLFNYDLSYFGLLLTTKTGGVGLNLTGANRIILFDPDWNPQTDAQARERAYRFGQKKAVTIYRLITAGTIEEKIYHRQIFKTALTNQILQDPKQRRLFSQKDLKDLFTLQDDVHAEGGNGITETAQITRGKGVVPSDSQGEAQEILKNQGLAGIFDHDFVDASQGSRAQREMEEGAQKAALRAARRLEESVRTDRFGSASFRKKAQEEKPAGFGAGAALPSSSALLARLRQRNADAKG